MFGTVLMLVQLADLVVLFFALWRWSRAGRPIDPTDDDFPNKWLTVALFAWLGWFALVIIALVYHLIIREWLSAAIEVLILLWVWWEFFGGKNKWKKLKKRIKERVAVIKGRLKVIQVPGPVPA